MSGATKTGEGRAILVLNTGSSSLKFGLYRVGSSNIEVLVSGEVDAIGESDAKFIATDGLGNTILSDATPISDSEDAVRHISNFLADGQLPNPEAIGHRVVHGGPLLLRHCVIDESAFKLMEDSVDFAPLHTPPALSVIRFAQSHFPDRPQIACFDTSFHANLPDVASTLPILKVLRSEGLRRYGFHGLSCESVVHQLGDGLPERLIVAHLGSGASVTAIRNGNSVDTSMGLTPTGGLIMSTRTGDIDPGVLIYLIRNKKLSVDELEELVDRKGGLLGISGLTGNMRGLHRAASSNHDACLAVEMFCYSVRKHIAAMIAALRGVDLVVFTGGIGENDEAVRAMICEGLSWAGLGWPQASNGKVYVMASKEEEQIARHTWALLHTHEALSQSDERNAKDKNAR